MRAIKTFVDNSKIEETVNLLNKAFAYADESEEDFKEVAKEALEKFFETYLAFGLSGTEKWTLVEGTKRYNGVAWENYSDLQIGVDFDSLAKVSPSQRMTSLADVVEQLVRAFYRGCMYRYNQLRKEQRNRSEGVEKQILAYENFFGEKMAPHFYNCTTAVWQYEEAEILARFFAYATGEDAFNKIADKLRDMDAKEKALMEEDEDDAEYRSFAFYPEELYRDIAVESVSSKLLANMVDITREMATNLDPDKLFFITPEGIKHIYQQIKLNREKFNNDYTDTSDETLEIGKLILKLSEQFNVEVYLNYLVGLVQAGNKMFPQNTTVPLEKVLTARGKGESLEEFARTVTALAIDRRNIEDDPELASIYSSIIFTHKIVSGDITQEEIDEFKRAEQEAEDDDFLAEDGFGEDEYDDGYDDDDYDDEDEGAGI